MFRRKQNKEIKLISITQRDGVPTSDEKYVPKTSTAVKARRRAVRSMSLENCLEKYEQIQPLQEKRKSQHFSQPDLLNDSPKTNMKQKPKILSSSPKISPSQSPATTPRVDAKLKLVPMIEPQQASSTQRKVSQEEKPKMEAKEKPKVHTSNYTVKIIPMMKPLRSTATSQAQSSNGTSTERNYRHSTYVTSGATTTSESALKRSKSQELFGVEEDEDVQELRFDDTDSLVPSPMMTSTPKSNRVTSKYEPESRERTSTASSMMFDVSYEL